MTIHHLFKIFLEDKQVYQNNDNVAYWKENLGKIVKDKSENCNWLEPQFINGESFFDGNPMVSLIRNPLVKTSLQFGRGLVSKSIEHEA